MRYSAYFIPTLREAPQGAQIISHQLMLRAGLTDQIASGIYAWLPLGFRVLQKISAIVREEQDRAGAIELLGPMIQPAELWKKSGRYNDYGKEMLRFLDRHETELLYGPTGEEILTDLFQRHIKSYRDLPKRLYQVQWKFRDEIRPRFGVMRSREFLMKDCYSFDLNQAEALKSYDAMLGAYYRTFERMGLKGIAVRADTGPIGGDLSHEFHVLADTGESTIYYDRALDAIPALTLETIHSYYAAEQGKHTPATCPVPETNLRSATSIEVGHLFYFGSKYSVPLGALVTNAAGARVPVEMGSYGIGVGRLVAAMIEASHDSKGIIWHPSVAPFDVGLLNLRTQDAVLTQTADSLYGSLREAGVDVLYDDRDESPGVKFASMDLIGLPYQVILGPQGLASGTLEVKERSSGNIQSLPLESLLPLMVDQKLSTLFQSNGT